VGVLYDVATEKKAEGMLIWDATNDRPCISWDNGGFEELHCGQAIEVFMFGAWEQTRLEMSDDWYLVGLYRAGEIPMGLKVRI
jgi:hypothetical protein